MAVTLRALTLSYGMWSLGILALANLDSAASGQTLRDRAVSLNEAAPRMQLFDDYTTIGADFADLEDWQEQDQERQKLINTLEAALKGQLGRGDRFDLGVKLYEAYLQREVFLRYQIERQHIAKWFAYQRGNADQEPVLDFTDSQKMTFKAIGQMRELVGKFKKHPRLDQVVYQLARNLCKIQNDNNRFYFQQYHRQFPNSQIKKLAALAQADCHIGEQNVTDATKILRQIIADKTTKTYLKAYAAYQLGWLQVSQAVNGKANQELNFTLAERSLRAVVLYAREDDEQKKRLVDLEKRALGDLAMLYANRGLTAIAGAYFKAAEAPQYMADYHLHQALLAAQQGNHALAISATNALITGFPKFRHLPWASEIMLAEYQAANSLPGILHAIKVIAKTIDEDSDWSDTWEDDTALHAEVLAQAEFLLRNTANQLLEIAANQDNQAIRNYGTQVLQIYLKSFPESSRSRDVAFQIASSQFQLGMFKVAAKGFTRVLEDIPEGHDLHRDAHFNKVLALTNLEKQTKFKAIPNGKLKDSLELPPLKEELIETMTAFIESFPNDEAAMPMRFAVNQIYMDYGYYEDGIEQLEKIALSDPESEAGINALQTILAFYSGNGDWQGLRQRTLEYLENPRFLLPKVQQLLGNSLTQADKAIKTMKANK